VATKREGRLLQLLAFFKEAEVHGKPITIPDMCSVTGWKRDTCKTYISKGVFSVLVPLGKGHYSVQGAEGLTDQGFLRLFSQSKKRQKFGHQFDPLARQLLVRSRTNMSLAVEVFNRPALENRLDAFVVMFIAAWEQLMKAELEARLQGSIFTGEKTNMGRDKTITFKQCLDRLFEAKDPVRKNLEVIRSLRDEAAHLLVAEFQPVASRFFQAGLINYCDRFFEFTEEPPFPATGTGLLTLALPYHEPDVVALRERYGFATASEVTALMQAMEKTAGEFGDRRYAVSVKYRLVLTDNPGSSSIYLSKGKPDDSSPGIIVEKPKDFEKVYCYFPGELGTRLTELTGRSWNRHDVQATLFKEKMKTSNNEFHHHFKKTNRHGYSEACVEKLTRKLREDESYIERAKAWYGRHLKKKREERNLDDSREGRGD
jgi:hypothetical protein